VEDDDLLNSTDAFWGSEDAGVNCSDFGRALEGGADDDTSTQGALPLLPNFGIRTSDSAFVLGISESVPEISTDTSIAFDYDYGYDNLSFFSFDDYLYIEPDHTSTASTGVTSTSSGLEPSPVLIPDSLLTSQSSISSSPSKSPFAQQSSEINFPEDSLGASTGSPPAPALKREISHSSSFRCPKCPATFAFQSKLTYIYPLCIIHAATC
jgi:hypothetical protein